MMPLQQEQSAPEAELRAIVALLDDGDTAAALDALKPMLTTETPSLAARFLLAMTAWTLERFDWALSLLRACHAEVPDHGEIAEALASLEAQLGHLEESLFIAKLATAAGRDAVFGALVPVKFPGFDRAFLSIVEHPLLGEARRRFAEGRLADATERVRQHVAIEPDHIAGRAFHAECLLLAGSASAAAETLIPLDVQPAVEAAHASLYGRALAAIGEHEAARRWHDRAITQKPQDAAIAAACVADASFLAADGVAVETLARDWAAQFGLRPRPVRKYRSTGKTVVAYLVGALCDPADADAIAAAARAHDRSRIVVLGFGQGHQTAEHNAALTGCFGKWRDVYALDPTTLARTFAGEGVDVLVDCGGFASALQLQALSACASAVRVSWLGNAAGMLAPLYDVRLTAADYPIIPAQRAPRGIGETLAFGADIGMAQLDIETVGLWSSVLQAVPEAKLVLRARDMTAPANIARLVARFGNALAARIDLRNAEQATDFYAAIDIALMPLRAISPRAAAEALAHGVPPVALAGAPYGDFLTARGLGRALVAGNGGDYRALALALANAPERRVLPALETGAARLVRTIEAAARLEAKGAAA